MRAPSDALDMLMLETWCGLVWVHESGCVLAYEDVLHNVDLAGVLAETSNADAVAAVAGEVLDNNVCAVGFEGNAVVAVVDV
jgi:hypothetical protein